MFLAGFLLERLLVCVLFLLRAKVTTASRGGVQIIGAGWGRTGTKSLKVALDALGYKTYHMTVLIENFRANDFRKWTQYYRGETYLEDLTSTVFEKDNFTAVIDHPVADAWSELADFYPEAKIILTERSTPEKWWESASETILIQSWPMRTIMTVVPFFRTMNACIKAFQSHTFGMDRSITQADKEMVIQAYKANSAKARVMAENHPDRVLIFHPSQGWGPLCAFLGKDIPDSPFPFVNSRAEFHGVFVVMLSALVIVAALVVAILLWMFRKCFFSTKKSEGVKRD